MPLEQTVPTGDKRAVVHPKIPSLRLSQCDWQLLDGAHKFWLTMSLGNAGGNNEIYFPSVREAESLAIDATLVR